MRQVEQEFVRLYIRGYSCTAIARILHVSVSDVRELEQRLASQRVRLQRRRSPDFVEPIF